MIEKKVLYAYYPGKLYPAVSVTGNRCDLNCAHCGGHYLSHMIAADEIGALYRLCVRLWNGGAIGVLISGGCDRNGKIDLEPFYPDIERIKNETGLIVNIHTGLLDETDIRHLKRIGVDAVSFDFTGDERVITEIYGLKAGAEDYRRCLELLIKYGLNVVPHICLGLNPSQPDEERKTVESLKPYGLKRLIFIIFIPTKGTEMEDHAPPAVEQVTSVIFAAHSKLPNTALMLGCMRPRRSERYELAAVEAGIDGIVLPSKSTLAKLRNDGWRIIRSERCCAI